MLALSIAHAAEAAKIMIENPMEMDDDWGYPYLRKPPLSLGQSLNPCFVLVISPSSYQAQQLGPSSRGAKFPGRTRGLRPGGMGGPKRGALVEVALSTGIQWDEDPMETYDGYSCLVGGLVAIFQIFPLILGC